MGWAQYPCICEVGRPVKVVRISGWAVDSLLFGDVIKLHDWKQAVKESVYFGLWF